jgi:hypothetical protein
MKKADALLAAALKRTTDYVRSGLTYNVLLTGSVRLILDFDELGAVWSTELVYKNRRRSAAQTFYGPNARTPLGALSALRDKTDEGLP